jgi:hypothetical protein
VRRKAASAGLGAEYERQVLSQTEKRERRAVAFRASRFVYRLLSWLLSLVLTFAIFLATFAIADAFLSGNLSVVLALVALLLCVWAWLVPASDYQHFVTRDEPAKSRGRLKLDLRIVKRAETGERER